MTSPRSAASPSSRRGFTLVELLAVLGIVMLLMGILVAVIARTRSSAALANAKNSLQIISQALDQYAHDFRGLYPMSRDDRGAPIPGMRMLAKALIGPGPATGVGNPKVGPRPLIEDGLGEYDNPLSGSKNLEDPKYREYLETESQRNLGFRAFAGGSPHKAYLDPGHFKPTLVNTQLGWQWEFLDTFGTPYAYLPRRNPAASANVVDSGGMFDPADIVGLEDKLGPLVQQRLDGVVACLRIALGDANGNNRIDAGETLRHTGKFVLISAGPEGIFFSDPGRMNKNDNLYNFER